MLVLTPTLMITFLIATGVAVLASTNIPASLRSRGAVLRGGADRAGAGRLMRRRRFRDAHHGHDTHLGRDRIRSLDRRNAPGGSMKLRLGRITWETMGASAGIWAVLSG